MRHKESLWALAPETMAECPTSPPHSVFINQTAKSRKAVLPERDTHAGDKPSCMTDSQWETMQPALKKIGTTAASKKQKMDAVYVNLDSRLDRKESIEHELAKAGFKSKRLSAQTGHDAPDDCVTRTWDTSINCQYDPSTIKKGRVSLTPGERGCAMSHAVLWARCAAQGDAGVPMLVVEDDVQFREGAGEAVTELVKHLETVNPVPSQRLMMLYLTGDVAAWRDKKSQSVEGEYDVKLREAEYIWQTACYVIWPAAARRLLQSLPVDGPVDNFISKHSLHKRVCALVTTPNLAWQAAPYEEGDIAHSGHTWKMRAFGGTSKEAESAGSPPRAKAGAASERDSPGTHLMHHLAEVPGIGPKLAALLRDHARTIPGGLTTSAQLDGLEGLGKKRQADVVRYLQLKPAAGAPAPAPPTKQPSKDAVKPAAKKPAAAFKALAKKSSATATKPAGGKVKAPKAPAAPPAATKTAAGGKRARSPSLSEITNAKSQKTLIK